MEDHESRECAKAAQLSRTPKSVVQPESAPNTAVSPDFTAHQVQSTPRDILVVLDSGDLMMRLGFLCSRAGRTYFLSSFPKRSAYFDSSIFEVVDRGPSLTELYM